MAYAFNRRANNEIIDASHINELQVAIEDISTNGGITVATTPSVTLALVAGELTASAIFGTTAGSIAEGSALALKADADTLNDHMIDTANPHGVTKAQVGLGSVDNTSDLGKPISVPTQLALDGKAPKVHVHAIADVTGLQDELDERSDIMHTHVIADTTGLQAALDSKSAIGHTHDDRYFTETEVNTLLSGKASTTHNHDSVYALINHTHAISQITNLQTALDSKAAASHTHTSANVTDFAEAVRDTMGLALEAGSNVSLTVSDLTDKITIASTMPAHDHDTRYYTETEIDTALAGKSNTNHTHAGVYALVSHTHAIADVTGLQAALDAKAASAHTHGVSDLTATGTRSASTFLRGDNTWSVPIDTTYATITQAEAQDALSSVGRLVSGQRLQQAVAYHAPVKTADLTAHTGRTDNPHAVTKTQVGLGNVDNTSDLSKPVSTATQTALNGKAATSHTHTSAQITDLAETVRDTMGTALAAGSNISIVPDDLADTITINASMPAHNHDDRYYTETEVDTIIDGVVAGEPAPHDHDDRYYTETEMDTMLAGKASTTHVHAAGDITTGTLALARIPTGTTGTTVALGNHTHAGVYANASHTHAIADVTNLQTTLDAKAASSHTHTAANITDFSAAADARIATQKGAANGLATLGADSKIPTSQIPAVALTDVHTVTSQTAQLALQAQEGEVAVRTDLGRTFIHNGGTSGSMADWTEISAPDAVTSVNGQLGVVVLDKGDVGLANVDNTSDLDKPISTATATALSGKASSSHSHAATDITSGTLNIARVPTGTTSTTVALGNHTHSGVYAPVTHSHAAGDITTGTLAIARIPTGTTNTTVALGDHNHSGVYALVSHSHAIADVTGLQTALDSKAASSHTHASAQITDLAETVRDIMGTALVGGANVSLAVDDINDTITISSSLPAHAHDDRYYTETEIDTALAGKSDTSHTHDTRYYTETEIDTALAGKANSAHTHAIGDVTNLQTTLDGKAASSHTHAVTDMTATGTRSSSTYLRGDNTWATPTNTTYAEISTAEVQSTTSTTGRLISGRRFAEGVAFHAPVKTADLANYALASHLHDDRYYTETEVDTALAGKSNTGHTHVAGDITSGTLAIAQIPTGTTGTTVALGNHTHANYALTSHTHAISDVTGLQTALDGKAAASHTHGVTDLTATGTKSASTFLRGDNVWATPPDTNTTYSVLSQADVESSIDTTSGLVTGQRLSQAVLAHAPVKTTDLATKADVGHSHVIADTTGLQSALDGKAASTHTHGVGDLTATGTKTTTTFLRGDNTWAVPPDTNTTYSVLTQLDAENAADTTAGLVTGQRLSQAVLAHAPVKAADLATKADLSHVHDAGDITSGTFAIARIPTGTTSTTVALGNHTHSGYALTSHTHTASQITNFEETVRDAMGTALVAGTNIALAVDDVADTITINASVGSHTHDDRYYTETEVDTALAGKANTSHTHAVSDMTATGTRSSATYLRGDNTWATPPNTTYSLATQAEVENSASTTARLVSGQRLYQAVLKHAPVKTTDLAGYALVGHTHAIADVNDLQSALDAKVATTDYNTDQVINTLAHTTLQSNIDAKADANHNHDSSYLKLTGGTLSGPLNVNAEVRDTRRRSLVFNFNNGDLPLQVGQQVDLFMPFNATIIDSHAIMDASGTIGISLWRRPGPNIPTSAYSMGSLTLTGPLDQEAVAWTNEDLYYNDILRANITSVSGSITRLSWNITIALL